jgi:hypothetical protein
MFETFESSPRRNTCVQSRSQVCAGEDRHEWTEPQEERNAITVRAMSLASRRNRRTHVRAGLHHLRSCVRICAVLALLSLASPSSSASSSIASPRSPAPHPRGFARAAPFSVENPLRALFVFLGPVSDLGTTFLYAASSLPYTWNSLTLVPHGVFHTPFLLLSSSSSSSFSLSLSLSLSIPFSLDVHAQPGTRAPGETVRGLDRHTDTGERCRGR